jgi:hypothetical protein
MLQDVQALGLVNAVFGAFEFLFVCWMLLGRYLGLGHRSKANLKLLTAQACVILAIFMNSVLSSLFYFGVPLEQFCFLRLSAALNLVRISGFEIFFLLKLACIRINSTAPSVVEVASQVFVIIGVAVQVAQIVLQDQLVQVFWYLKATTILLDVFICLTCLIMFQVHLKETVHAEKIRLSSIAEIQRRTSSLSLGSKAVMGGISRAV